MSQATDVPRLGFIGAGSVGTTLAYVWHERGIPITSVFSRRIRRAERLARLVNAKVADSGNEVVNQSDIVFLTVSDNAIETVAQRLRNADWYGKAVVHTSGATSVDNLQSLAECGATVGSLHPALPFAEVESAIKAVNGATFAIETPDDNLRQTLRWLVTKVGGRTIDIPDGAKSIYHTALVFASNYTVTLYSIAEQMLIGLGAEQSVVNQALNTLMTATIENLQTQGIPLALTGPLSRGDTQTIRSHLQALESHTLLTDLYKELARLSYPMLRDRKVNVDLIEQILERSEDEHHASDDS